MEVYMINGLSKRGPLSFYNGIGGFDTTKSEYRFSLAAKSDISTPWSNVIANPHFGTLVTDRGAAFTWFENSHLYRLTPRVDDPILQTSGERLYIRLENGGTIETLLPVSRGRDAIISHGKGYTNIEQELGDLQITSSVTVSTKDPIKLTRLSITNRGSQDIDVGLGYYNEFVLGEDVENTRQFLVTRTDHAKGLVYTQNPLHQDFPKTIVYIGSNAKETFCYENKQDFIGDGNEDTPEGLTAVKKSKPTGIIPAGVVGTKHTIQPGKTMEVLFYIGVAQKELDEKDVKTIDIKYFEQELGNQRRYFEKLRQSMTIKTPVPELDLLFNEQLMYQTLVSRYWARTGFYQPGGAYGYRDQLQDSMIFLWSNPNISREHILLAASRQFLSGGVQHWWHPPGGSGVESQSSDAGLWLAFATLRYLKITGDDSILSEKVSYLSSRGASSHTDYYRPESTTEKATIYEHIRAAIDRTLFLVGERGLPLMLSGDWNDGLSKVGEKKCGESVWMAMFLAKILEEILPVLEDMDEQNIKDLYQQKYTSLLASVEKYAWDKDWYIRGFFDDGTPFGNAGNAECSIDSLPQSWSAIATGFRESRTKKAIYSANTKLIDKHHKVVKLFDPPFTTKIHDPGYIALYPEGVRENGGAYSHAAAWLAQANALLGDGETAMQIVNYLNPIFRTKTLEDTLKYRGEPYVTAADIFTGSGHEGMAGWTWYTGSSAVLYSVVLENILGLKIHGNHLRLVPSVPKNWKEYTIQYLYKDTPYTIEYRKNPRLRSPLDIAMYLDGVLCSDQITLVNDKHEHRIVYETRL
jgi:cyclic beta-1,2-glucan synthetase